MNSGENMKIFNFFKRRKSTTRKARVKPLDLNKTACCFDGFLGKAAKAGHDAKASIKAQEFDKAWRLFHEKKSFYVKHANMSGFSAKESLSLISNVHEDFANILRIEGKDYDAFLNILYWIIASSERPIKRQEQKLSTYFNRCKFKNTQLEDVKNYILAQKNDLADYHKIRDKIAKWKELE